jgi:uncharacterized protein YndB with AHSA1/START domain
MPVCEIDLRPGGTWRYVHEGPDGPCLQMSGEHRDIQAPERIVNTETMDDAPATTFNALTRAEKVGRTLARTVVDYPARELGEQIIATGMMDGWAESYDRLQTYLRTVE